MTDSDSLLMSEIDTLQKAYEAVTDQKALLLAKVASLQTLVHELVPYMLTEVRMGLEVGPFDGCPDPECVDCAWYEHCVKWKHRIESGELGALAL